MSDDTAPRWLEQWSSLIDGRQSGRWQYAGLSPAGRPDFLSSPVGRNIKTEELQQVMRSWHANVRGGRWGRTGTDEPTHWLGCRAGKISAVAIGRAGFRNALTGVAVQRHTKRRGHASLIGTGAIA
jgi:hypothetical protein